MVVVVDVLRGLLSTLSKMTTASSVTVAELLSAFVIVVALSLGFVDTTVVADLLSRRAILLRHFACCSLRLGALHNPALLVRCTTPQSNHVFEGYNKYCNWIGGSQASPSKAALRSLVCSRMYCITISQG